MAELRFTLSGSTIATVRSDCVPPAGSEVIVRFQEYKKGYQPGTLIRFTVEGNHCEPNVYDFTGEGVTVSLDVNGFTVLEDALPPED